MNDGALPEAYPPRHIGRRFFAYAIDFAIVWIFVALAMGFLVENPLADDLSDTKTTYGLSVSLSSGEFQPPVDVSTVTCGRPNEALAVLQGYFAPATVATAEVCYQRSYGMLIGAFAKVGLADTPEAGDLAGQILQVPMTIHNLSRFSQPIALATFLAFSIGCLWLFGSTPGKKIMLLQIIGRRPVPALRREIVRMFPYILAGTTFLVLELLGAPGSISPSTVEALVIAAQIASILAVVVLWIWPLAIWRGGFFHDRWLGLSVFELDEILPLPPEESEDRQEGEHP